MLSQLFDVFCLLHSFDDTGRCVLENRDEASLQVLVLLKSHQHKDKAYYHDVQQDRSDAHDGPVEQELTLLLVDVEVCL